MIDRYDGALTVVLDHQPLTLLVAFATLCLTIWLYVIVPKGFFPVQDTGVLQGISVAAQSTSFGAMAKNQQELADAILKDPDVVSLSSFIGVDGSNTDTEHGSVPDQSQAQGRPDAECDADRPTHAAGDRGDCGPHSICNRCRT